MVLPLPLKNKEVLKVDMADARDEVDQQLAKVYDPELDQPLTELGFIGGVDIAGDKVTVRFRLPTYWCAANFAYMMASDIRERVSELPWVKQVDVLLQDHFHDEEINEGIKHGKTFLTAFPDATESLDDLRETFRVKAFQARQERVLRWLIRKGLQEEAILQMRVGDLQQLLKKRQVAKLVERYLSIRQERGLPGDIGAEALRTPTALQLTRAGCNCSSIRPAALACRWSSIRLFAQACSRPGMVKISKAFKMQLCKRTKQRNLRE